MTDSMDTRVKRLEEAGRKVAEGPPRIAMIEVRGSGYDSMTEPEHEACRERARATPGYGMPCVDIPDATWRQQRAEKEQRGQV